MVSGRSVRVVGLACVCLLVAGCASETETSAGSSSVPLTEATSTQPATVPETSMSTTSTIDSVVADLEFEDQGGDLASLVLGEGETLVLARGDEVEIHRDGRREVVAHVVANPLVHEPTGNGWMYAEGAFVSAGDDSVRCDYPTVVDSAGVVGTTVGMRDGTWFAQIEQISAPESFMVDCRSGLVVDQVPFLAYDPSGEGESRRTIERGGTQLLVLADAEGSEQIGRVDGSLVSDDTTFGGVLDPSGSFLAYADHTIDEDGPREGVVSAFDTSRVVVREVENGGVVHEVVLPATVLTPLFFNERFVVTEIGRSPNAPGIETPGYQVAVIELATGTVSIFDTIGVPVLLGDPPVLGDS